ncbi:MAG: CheR family methyltransferase [Eubacteriales bacterium]
MENLLSVANEVVHVMKNIYGLDVSVFDESFMQKTISSRCAVQNIPVFPDYSVYLSNNSAEASNLLNTLNNNYSEFFRNSLTFANLEQWILPKLIQQKADSNELRIWSAGCAAGQEPYSIAMLLEAFSATRSTSVRYRIIATDISNSALETAKNGEYNEDALQNMKMKFVKAFFEKTGEKYKVISSLKENIEFSVYDLLDKNSFYPHESIFGDFDIVFCSNLLFYYKPGQQQFILNKMIRAMAKDGYLITGEAEKNLLANRTDLHMAAPPAAIFQFNGLGGTK